MRVEVLKSNLMARPLEFRGRIMNDTFGVENDFDKWDCVALHICCMDGNDIVGYYRAIPYTAMGFYTETEFDLSNLNVDKHSILEIGRACVDSQHSNPVIIPQLWGAIIKLAKTMNKTHIMGAASLMPSKTDVINARDSWRAKYQYLDGGHAIPLNPFDGESSGDEIPKLIKVYEKVGARIVSDPSYDPIFKTADVVTMLEIEETNKRWLDKLMGNK